MPESLMSGSRAVIDCRGAAAITPWRMSSARILVQINFVCATFSAFFAALISYLINHRSLSCKFKSNPFNEALIKRTRVRIITYNFYSIFSNLFGVVPTNLTVAMILPICLINRHDSVNCCFDIRWPYDILRLVSPDFL